MRPPYIMNTASECLPVGQAGRVFQWFFAFCFVIFGLRALCGSAASLTFVSDTVSTSRPSYSAIHTFRFTLTSSVPASGKIIITPEAGIFVIPDDLNYADMDFSVNGASKILAALPGNGSGGAIGVSVTAGSAGKIIFTLNDADALISGSGIVVRVGAGSRRIINPSLDGSYRLNLKTQNAAGTTLDHADAMIAVASAVSVGVSSGAPAQIQINNISDNTIPSIAVNVTIVNEGVVGYEYQYEWCVVSSESNSCGDNDDIAYSSAAKYLNVGQSWTTDLNATVSNVGNYWFKAVVHYGVEKSSASQTFTAVREEAPPVGRGNGGGELPPPSAIPPVAPAPRVCYGADFNIDGIVNSTDFSILLYFWKTRPPFSNPCVDINNDKSVNSIDFSIMLYQWGGVGINTKI